MTMHVIPTPIMYYNQSYRFHHVKMATGKQDAPTMHTQDPEKGESITAVKLQGNFTRSNFDS